MLLWLSDVCSQLPSDDEPHEFHAPIPSCQEETKCDLEGGHAKCYAGGQKTGFDQLHQLLTADLCCYSTVLSLADIGVERNKRPLLALL